MDWWKECWKLAPLHSIHEPNELGFAKYFISYCNGGGSNFAFGYMAHSSSLCSLENGVEPAPSRLWDFPSKPTPHDQRGTRFSRNVGASGRCGVESEGSVSPPTLPFCVPA